HCIDRIAYEGVWTKHSGGDGLEVTHSLVGSQNPASQINELRPSVTVTRTSPSPTSRLGLSVIPTRKAIHQSDVVNRPYDMTESTLSVQIFILFIVHLLFFFLIPTWCGNAVKVKQQECTVGRPCSQSSFIPRRAPLI